MRIDAETIERIKQSAQIAEVIGDYVSLKKKGANLWACCPFHGEKSPSFSVSPAKGIYKCFGCGKAGDSVRFIMDIEGLGYGEALRHLAKKYGIAINESPLTDEQLQAQNTRESLYIALNYAKNYYQNTLFSHDEGQSIGYPYFKERGFSDKTIKAFELGYSLDNWDAFTKTAQQQGYSIDMLEKAGLTIRKPEEQKQFDRFRNRVIFPIHNVSGKTIAFGARILKNDKNQPKYLNSPETEVYHKSAILYGIFQAKNAIRNKDVCYLVEGYTDVISLHQAGIENVVASSGTSLTLEQIRLIARFTQNITVLYDGDPAGIKASLRGMDMILEEGLNVKLVVFPQGEDPDSYVRSIGAEAFINYIEQNASDFITFKATLFLQEAGNDPFKRAALIKDMVESISKIPDAIKRSVFFKKTASLMQIDENVLIAESNKITLENLKQKDKEAKRQPLPTATQLQQDLPAGVSLSDLPSFSEDDLPPEAYITTPQVPVTPPPAKLSSTALHELECIRLLINYGTKEADPHAAPGVSLMQYILSEINEMNFKTPVYQEILTICRQKFLEGVVVDTHYFINHPIPEIQQEAIHLVAEKYSVSELWLSKHEIIVPTEIEKLHQMAYTNILRLKKAFNDEHIKALMTQLSTSKNADEQTQILMALMEAKNLEKQIAKELGTVVAR